MADDNRFRVLLVEDDAIQVNIIRKVLETASKTPIRVEVVGNLETALLVLQDKDNQIDSILLDLNLPDSAGLDTVIRVQEIASDIPVVVMTGDDDEKKGDAESGEDALAPQASFFLSRRKVAAGCYVEIAHVFSLSRISR